MEINGGCLAGIPGVGCLDEWFGECKEIQQEREVRVDGCTVYA